MARHGGVNFLVNLACSYVDNGIQASRADWLTSMNVNVASAVMMLKAAHPHMQKAGGGAVVNFTSISSSVAQTGRWLYPTSTAIFGGGVNAFSRYENGKTKPPLALVKLLKVLDRHPDLLSEVRAA